jgi:hypothetical protein
MHKVDHSSAGDSGEFISEDPQTGREATVVTVDWLNAVQSELVNVVEALGITLDKQSNDQLLTAIRGLRDNDTNVFALNNNVTDQDITGLSFDPGLIKSVVFEYDIHRKDDNQEVVETGKLSFHWKPNAQQWVMLVSDNVSESDSGVSFGFSVVGDVLQIQYSTNNFDGANYAGTLRYKLNRFLNQ